MIKMSILVKQNEKLSMINDIKYIPSDWRSSAKEFPASEVLVCIEEDLEGGNEASSSVIKWGLNKSKGLIMWVINNFGTWKSINIWWKSWKYLQAEMWKWYLPDYVT